MVPGPVFTFELMMTARRWRFYASRAFYATVLLLILWSVHAGWASAYEGEIPAHRVKDVGLSAFGAIAAGQELLILLLTPALVAGAIADEKRRKTLHYLLASRLSGPEIVLGKLLVRMLYVGVLLGVSVPVMSLLVLLGGLDPMLVLLGCGGLLSTAWFLATLSIWVSTIARRPREALFVAFGLEALWLVVPPVLRYRISTGRAWVDDTAEWLGLWIGASSPIQPVWQTVLGVVMRRPPTWQADICWMIGLQAAAGAVLAALAAVQLRPLFKRQDGAIARPRGLRARLAARRLRAHRPLGDRPMIWRELHTGGARGFARFIGWLLTLILGGLLLYYTARFGLMAAVEMWQYGYPDGANWWNFRRRRTFQTFVAFVTPLLYLVGILTVAGSASASITSEHEDDTWVSLTATDLTGPEIVLSKLLGSIWRARRLALVILLLIGAGIYVGSVHWLSLPAIVLALAVYGWLAAALGLWVSMQLRSTWRAQFLTIAALLLLNVVGQGVINLFSPRGYAPQVWPGFTPYEISKLVMDREFFSILRSDKWPWFWRLRDIDDGPGWLATFSVMSLVIDASLAAFLTRDALRRFEGVAGRARRGVRPPGSTAVADPAYGLIHADEAASPAVAAIVEEPGRQHRLDLRDQRRTGVDAAVDVAGPGASRPSRDVC